MIEQELPDLTPPPFGRAEILDYLNANFEPTGNMNQWRNDHCIVEYSAGEVAVWNRLNMRGAQIQFNPNTDAHDRQKGFLRMAREWLDENANKPIPIPLKWQV